MSKSYKKFKYGDAVTVKTMDEVERDFVLVSSGEDTDIYYSGALKDVYFSDIHRSLCGKQVHIESCLSDGMSEKDNDYTFWSNIYFIKENPYIEKLGIYPCVTEWSVTMFKEGITD